MLQELQRVCTLPESAQAFKATLREPTP